VIISTHILPEVEMVCDQVQIIDKGKLVFNGSIDVLKRQRVGNKLLVGLRNAPNIQELLNIPGVAEAEALPSGLIRVRFENDATPAEAIVQTAVQQGWGLHQIAPDQTSLEDVFMQLTYQEQVAAPEQSVA
jgi:ABC-2 type transport system ATP-binding protein